MLLSDLEAKIGCKRKPYWPEHIAHGAGVEGAQTRHRHATEFHRRGWESEKEREEPNNWLELSRQISWAMECKDERKAALRIY